MNIDIIASTKVGYKMEKNEAIDFSGKSAGICYMKDDIKALFSEDKEKTLKRANMTLKSGHHSVFGHPTYNLSLEGIPKILAMILNNEKIYNTSEKSARYTKMKTSEKENELYEKWVQIYSKEIRKNYPQIDEKKVKKLAQENARYLISIFTPSTTMEYTVNFGQLNYIMDWFEEYIENEADSEFSIKLKKCMKMFLEKLEVLREPELNSKMKNRKLSIFDQRERKEEFGENYSINYLSSLAQLGQAQRHRTLLYEMSFLENPKYYVPEIIKDSELQEEWIKDISSLEKFFPQGMLVKVNERGTVENFILKCTERLCGSAQLEIMEQTKETLQRYMEEVKDKNVQVYNELKKYSSGARCTFPNWKCNTPCVFGPKGAMNRKI